MITTYDKLNDIRKKHKDKKISICTGSFDLFHYSHLMFLKYIKQHSDILIVVIKSDKDVKAKGKNRPIINENERIAIVDSVKYVDYTIISNHTHKTKIINNLIKNNNYSEDEVYRLYRDGSIFEKSNADVLYITNDKSVPKAINDLCKKINIKIKIIPVQGNDFHTSDIINKIINNS